MNSVLLSSSLFPTRCAIPNILVAIATRDRRDGDRATFSRPLRIDERIVLNQYDRTCVGVL